MPRDDQNILHIAPATELEEERIHTLLRAYNARHWPKNTPSLSLTARVEGELAGGIVAYLVADTVESHAPSSPASNPRRKSAVPGKSSSTRMAFRLRACIGTSASKRSPPSPTCLAPAGISSSSASSQRAAQFQLTFCSPAHGHLRHIRFLRIRTISSP